MHPHAQLPTLGGDAPVYRALELFDHISPRHIAIPVTDAFQSPHLRSGEIAIVDPESVTPINGELFAIRWNSGRVSLGQVWISRHYRFDARRNGFVHFSGRRRLGMNELAWSFGNYIRPRTDGEVEAFARAGTLSLVEGPFTTEHLKSKLLGLVVGVACFALFAGKGGAS